MAVGETMATNVHAVVLAAGAGRRMGQRKQLLAWQGMPMLRHVVATVIASDVASVTVVVSAGDPELVEALTGLAVGVVVNPDSTLGLLNSLKAGMKDVRSRHAPSCGVMVVLADQPLVGTPDYDRLVAAFVDQGGKALVAPFFAGRRGNPVVIPGDLVDLVLERPDADRGAAFLFADHPGRVFQVPMPTDGVHQDCDTPSDYERLQALGGTLSGEH